MGTVLVTGGSRGIGSGIVKTFAQAGYDVFFTYASAAEEAEKTREEAAAFGVRVFCIQASLERHEEPERVVKAAIQALGRIDVLVNNAGRTIRDSILELEDENLDMLLNLDFRAYARMVTFVSRHMVKHGIHGAIVSVTSTRSGRAYPKDGIYGGMKAALNRATESWALDLAPYGIRVNVVAPGAIQVRYNPEADARYAELAPRIPLGRQGFPADIGQAALFLADNERAGYITGVTLKVDGGLVLPGMPEFSGGGSWNDPPVEKTWDDTDL